MPWLRHPSSHPYQSSPPTTYPFTPCPSHRPFLTPHLPIPPAFQQGPGACPGYASPPATLTSQGAAVPPTPCPSHSPLPPLPPHPIPCPLHPFPSPTTGPGHLPWLRQPTRHPSQSRGPCFCHPLSPSPLCSSPFIPLSPYPPCPPNRALAHALATPALQPPLPAGQRRQGREQQQQQGAKRGQRGQGHWGGRKRVARGRRQLPTRRPPTPTWLQIKGRGQQGQRQGGGRGAKGSLRERS